jgi:ribosome-binding factor A
MSGGNPRRPRVSQAIREELGNLISSELHDPRLSKAGFLSINHVELNKDMGVAEVFIGFYGDDEKAGEEAVKILNRAAGRLRGPLGRTLKLQRAPELRFVHDKSSEFGVRLSQIIRDDEKRSTQGNPGEPGEPGEPAGAGESGDE